METTTLPTSKHRKNQTETERKAAVLEAFGMFERHKSSSEEFARRKPEEIEWEERNNRRPRQ